MGTALSGSLPLFGLSIVVWALKTFLFQIFACSSLAGVVLCLGLSTVLVLRIITFFFG